MEIIITLKVDDDDVKMINDVIKSKKDSKETVSKYARWFDEGCMGWTKDPETNLIFLRCKELYANTLLKTRKKLLLNDVYDMLGIPNTIDGAMVGWIYDKKNPIGDNFVDFGIYETRNARFVNGCEKNALLDFNVDGCVNYDLI